MFQLGINVAVLEDLTSDTPLELHEDSIDCLEDEVGDLAWVLDLVVGQKVAEDWFDTEQDEVLGLGGVLGGLVLNAEDVEEDLLLDFDDGFMVFKVTKKLWEDFIKEDEYRNIE